MPFECKHQMDKGRRKNVILAVFQERSFRPS